VQQTWRRSVYIAIDSLHVWKQRATHAAASLDSQARWSSVPHRLTILCHRTVQDQIPQNNSTTMQKLLLERTDDDDSCTLVDNFNPSLTMQQPSPTLNRQCYASARTIFWHEPSTARNKSIAKHTITGTVNAGQVPNNGKSRRTHLTNWRQYHSSLVLYAKSTHTIVHLQSKLRVITCQREN
jgi:hypothetical protein